jgi:hypothetical protein
VLHLDDAVSSKVNAMVGCGAPRDFIDVAAPLATGTAGPSRCVSPSPATLACGWSTSRTQLRQLGLEEFADYGLDGTALSELHQRFADWPREEEDDQEGLAVHAAVADEERRSRQ